MKSSRVFTILGLKNKHAVRDPVSNGLPFFQGVSSMEGVVCVAHLFAERRVPPGAIFREKIEG